jgi:Mg2+ and Co2+ transporter CorA
MLFDDLRQVETLQDNVGKLSAKAMKSALASNDYHELNVYEERLQHLELVFARNQRISAALGGHSALFPEGNERLLTQLSEQLQHAMRDVSHLTGNIDRVERRFEKQQASQQNRLLNNIAKVQLCATPAVVIGGFWGMNFPQTSAASNIFFWGTLSTMAAATAAIFWWSKKTHPPH